MLFEYLKEPTLGNYRASRDAFKYLERGMRLVGWLAPKKGTRFYSFFIAWNILAVFLAGVYVPIGFFASYFIDFSSFTPGDFLTSIQVAFNAAGLTLKIALLAPNMWRLQKAQDMLDIMDKRCVREEERIQVHRCVVLCNFTYLVYQIIYTSYAALTFVSSLLNRSTPWRLYNPFVDFRADTQSLLIAATVEFFCGLCAVFSEQMADLAPLIFGFVLRTHIQLLSERVQRLRTAPEVNDNQNYEELINCVKDHKLILQYCNIFRPIVTGAIFSQFLVIGVSLGFTMINLLFFSNLWTGLATIMCLILLMVETFPFCYLCELFVHDCNNLSSTIFYSNWMDANKRYKSAIVYFLHNTQQSIGFIAGGVFPVSMKTNIEVAKLAFSVVTLVKKMHIMDKLANKLNT